MKAQLIFGVLICLSCSPGEPKFKVGSKVFAGGELQLYSLADTLSDTELRAKHKDIVEYKKYRNLKAQGSHPRMFETFRVDTEQFYKSGNSYLGTIKSIQEFRYGTRSKTATFIEIEFDKSVKLTDNESTLLGPDFNIYKKVPGRLFVMEREASLDTATAAVFK